MPVGLLFWSHECTEDLRSNTTYRHRRSSIKRHAHNMSMITRDPPLTLTLSRRERGFMHLFFWERQGESERSRANASTSRSSASLHHPTARSPNHPPLSRQARLIQPPPISSSSR